MPQTVNGYTVPAGSDAISTIDDTLATFAGQFPPQTTNGGGSWLSYTPTLTASGTNPTLGTGSTVAGKYQQDGKTVFGWAKIVFGTTGMAAGTGAYKVSLPSTVLDVATAIGSGFLVDVSAYRFTPVSIIGTGSMVWAGTSDVVTNASPWTWAASDEIYIQFRYEGA
jgi:hypothetical protein